MAAEVASSLFRRDKQLGLDWGFVSEQPTVIFELLWEVKIMSLIS